VQSWELGLHPASKPAESLLFYGGVNMYRLNVGARRHAPHSPRLPVG
jgi:hypothetical protein